MVLTVMSQSTDDNRCDDRHFYTPAEAWNTRPSVPYHQPLNVACHQSSYGYPLSSPHASIGCVRPCSAQIANSAVPRLDASTELIPIEYPYISCQSVATDKQWYQKPELGIMTHCEHVPSKPAVAPAPVILPTLPSSPEDSGKSCCLDGLDKNCGNVYAENCRGMLQANPCNASSWADSCMSPVTTSATSTNDSKVDVPKSVPGSETTPITALSSASPVTPRPKCGRAKTNAELKRQLMERREQRLRDMLDGNAPASTRITASVASTSAYQQTEACTVVVG